MVKINKLDLTLTKLCFLEIADDLLLLREGDHMKAGRTLIRDYEHNQRLRCNYLVNI